MGIRTQCQPETPFEEEQAKSFAKCMYSRRYFLGPTCLLQLSIMISKRFFFFFSSYFLKRNSPLPLSPVSFRCQLKFLLSAASKNVTMVLGPDPLIGSGVMSVFSILPGLSCRFSELAVTAQR